MANLVGFNADLLRELSIQFLRARRKAKTAVPLMIGHRLMGVYLGYTGNIAQARAHYDQSRAGLIIHRCVSVQTGKVSDAVKTIISEIPGWKVTGQRLFMPLYLSNLARAYADLGQFDDAWRCIGEAMTAVETPKERWSEAEVNRMAGEIALMSSGPDESKAERYFNRAFDVARLQQGKSWELRAAMSMARLWRDQGKRDEARDLLAPVYGWFTEGFDTLDLNGSVFF
jgi:predicted ATPase